MSSRPYALLLASLGNPPPLHSTRHSAGHVLLRALSLHLHAPSFQRSKPHAGGQIAHSGDLTLWQSPTLMNVSGPAVLSAWKGFVRDHGGGGPGDEGVGLGLIVLHDELEIPAGTLKVRCGMGGSVKGHNGLKSVIGSLKSAGLSREMEGKLVRIGVGIGRPGGGGRARGEVSDYVLGKLTVSEKEGVEGLVERLVEVVEEEGTRMADVK